MTKTKINAKEAAEAIKKTADDHGFEIEIRGGVLTITKHFTPGSNDGFVECDMFYYSVLGCLPRTSPGSDWGTDGGGIGGLSAIKNGVFTMNRSGGSKQVLKALAKLL